MERGETIRRLVQSGYFGLLLALGLAWYVALIPRLNYPYPVHIDEWRQMAHSQALMRAGDINYPDPFSGELVSDQVTELEVGYHVLLGVFQRISGLSWLVIARYLPGIIFALTALAVYVFARREGFGWQAALFTCLLPTTIGILGPAFLVPVAVGLFFVPLSVFLAHNFRNLFSYVVLLLFIGFLMIGHAPSAVLLILILLPIIFLNFRDDARHAVSLLLVVTIPFVLTLPLTWELVVSTAVGFFTRQPPLTDHDLPRLMATYGFIPIAISLLGIFCLLLKWGARGYGLVLSIFILSAMAALFYSFRYGNALLYLRGLLFLMLLLSITAGYGLSRIASFRLPGSSYWGQKAGYLLCLALVVSTLFVAIPARQKIQYYYMIDDRDYEEFVWIRDNIGEEYEKALLDPWKATPFSAVTGKYVYTRIHSTVTPRDIAARKFLADGYVGSDFLIENGISIVYTREPWRNPDLMEVFPNVYILKP